MEDLLNFKNFPDLHYLKKQMKDILKPRHMKVIFQVFKAIPHNFPTWFLIYYYLDNLKFFDLDLYHKAHPR